MIVIRFLNLKRSSKTAAYLNYVTKHGQILSNKQLISNCQQQKKVISLLTFYWSWFLLRHCCEPLFGQPRRRLGTIKGGGGVPCLLLMFSLVTLFIFRLTSSIKIKHSGGSHFLFFLAAVLLVPQVSIAMRYNRIRFLCFKNKHW